MLPHSVGELGVVQRSEWHSFATGHPLRGGRASAMGSARKSGVLSVILGEIQEMEISFSGPLVVAGAPRIMSFVTGERRALAGRNTRLQK